MASSGVLCSLEILVWGRKHLGNMLQPHLPCSRQTLLTGPALPQYLRPSPAILSIALSTAEIKRQDLTCQDNLIPPHKRTTSLSSQWCRNQSCLCLVLLENLAQHFAKDGAPRLLNDVTLRQCMLQVAF